VFRADNDRYGDQMETSFWNVYFRKIWLENGLRTYFGPKPFIQNDSARFGHREKQELIKAKHWRQQGRNRPHHHRI